MDTWLGLTNEERKVLASEQRELELHALDLGVAQYRRGRVNRPEAASTPVQTLIGESIGSVSAGVEAARQHVLDGTASRGKGKWAMPIWCLTPEKHAIIALVTLFNQSADVKTQTVTGLASQIGQAIKQERELELIYRHHSRKELKEAGWASRSLTPRQLQHWKRKLGRKDEFWSHGTRTWIGMKLIEIVMSTTDLFIHEWRYEKKRRSGILRLNPDVANLIQSSDSDLEVLHPPTLPMVCKPGPWASGQRGGYLYHTIPLVKNGFSSGNRIDEPMILTGGDMDPVYAALNRLAGTALRIEPRVLATQELVWQAGGGWADIPERCPEPLSPIPEAEAQDKEKLNDYKKRAYRRWCTIKQGAGMRQSTGFRLSVARSVKERPIWFPHNLDWRGRTYSIGRHLNLQGQDSSRGMMTFADGEPVNDEAMEQLYIHTANCFGKDKLPYHERVAFVEENKQQIRACAEDPLEWKWWADEEHDQWQALAACNELTRIWDGAKSTHLPCLVDGTCNGLQHLACMGMDAVGAAAVNLLPCDRPSDIYQVIADEVARLLDIHRIDSTSPLHSFTVTRKAVKRSVMATPYGMTASGMMSAILEDKITAHLEQPGKAAALLRDLILEAIEGRISSARSVMDWLRTVAQLTAAEEYAVEWTMPSGFPVSQHYLIHKAQTINTLLQKVTLRIAQPDTISKKKQAAGLPPNFVHAWDGEHLRNTVNRCWKRGITSMVTIHDCFGCHATKVKLMQSTLREELVRLYTLNDPLADLRDEVEEATGLTLPAPPEKGSLDIYRVLDAEYAFS